MDKGKCGNERQQPGSLDAKPSNQRGASSAARNGEKSAMNVSDVTPNAIWPPLKSQKLTLYQNRLNYGKGRDLSTL